MYNYEQYPFPFLYPMFNDDEEAFEYVNCDVIVSFLFTNGTVDSIDSFDYLHVDHTSPKLRAKVYHALDNAEYDDEIWEMFFND